MEVPPGELSVTPADQLAQVDKAAIACELKNRDLQAEIDRLTRELATVTANYETYVNGVDHAFAEENERLKAIVDKLRKPQRGTMTDPIEVIAVGEAVSIGDHIDGVVTGVMIEANATVQYRVAWFDGRSRKSEWLHECEVGHSGSEKTKVGFTTRGKA